MNKGQSQQQPDWAKFGLEPNERQPLNPQQTASSAAAPATAQPPPPPAAPSSKGGGGDLFGGQVQSANELFADDQVRTHGTNGKERNCRPLSLKYSQDPTPHLPTQKIQIT